MDTWLSKRHHRMKYNPIILEKMFWRCLKDFFFLKTISDVYNDTVIENFISSQGGIEIILLFFLSFFLSRVL